MPNRLGVVAVLVSLAFVSLSFGQTVPQAEISAGYCYARNYQKDLITITGPNGSVTVSDIGFRGWHSSATGNITKWLGATVDFGSYYSDIAPIDLTKIAGNPDIAPLVTTVRAETFMAGPQVSYRKNRVAVFGHALFGGVHGQTKARIAQLSSDVSDTVFGYGFGGGIDGYFSRNVGIRLQTDYFRSSFGPPQAFGDTFGKSTQNNIRASIGIVFRLGSMGRQALPARADDNRSRQATSDLVTAGLVPALGISGVSEADGVRITSVAPNSPAARASLAVDDVILTVNGKPASTIEQITAAIGEKGESKLTFRHKYWTMDTTVKLD